MTSVLNGVDYVVLALYFLVLIGIAVWVALQKNKSTEDYFLAGRHVGWFVIGCSIFASNIGSEHVVGLAGTGFESGTPMAHYELHAWIVKHYREELGPADLGDPALVRETQTALDELTRILPLGGGFYPFQRT